MRMLTFFMILLGVLLIIIAYIGEAHNWGAIDLFLVLGLSGYLLVITAIAWCLLTILDKYLDDIV